MGSEADEIDDTVEPSETIEEVDSPLEGDGDVVDDAVPGEHDGAEEVPAETDDEDDRGLLERLGTPKQAEASQPPAAPKPAPVRVDDLTAKMIGQVEAEAGPVISEVVKRFAHQNAELHQRLMDQAKVIEDLKTKTAVTTRAHEEDLETWLNTQFDTGAKDPSNASVFGSNWKAANKEQRAARLEAVEIAEAAAATKIRRGERFDRTKVLEAAMRSVAAGKVASVSKPAAVRAVQAGVKKAANRQTPVPGSRTAGRGGVGPSPRDEGIADIQAYLQQKFGSQ